MGIFRRKDPRNERVKREIEMITPRFRDGGGVIHDDTYNYIIIPKYALPAKWKKRWCSLMMVFPASYPASPPIGFYLNQLFKLKDGGRDSHLTGKAYDGAPDMRGSGWYWYCVRVKRGAWRPSTDYREPDNLWTYLNMIREVLTTDF